MSTDTKATWTPCAERLPPRGVVVMTRIDDVYGVRNVQPLKLDDVPGSNLWFFADGSVYVYYCPTHWRPIEPLKGE